MRVQRITTRSEALAEQVIRRTLTGTGWSVAVKLPLQVVLDHEGEDLPYEHFQLLTRGHLDFTIYSDVDHQPAFAIEFDGFGHDYPEQAARDLVKNRLCARAGLPLVRIGFAELHERERISVLEWLVERFVSWQVGQAEDLSERYGMFELLPDGQVVRPDTDDPLERLNLEAATFSSEHPFPGNATLAIRLLRRFDIAAINELPEDKEAGHRATYTVVVEWPGRRSLPLEGRAGRSIVSERSAKLRARASPGEVLFESAGRARLTFVNKTGMGVAEEAALDPDPPWLDPEWMVIDLAGYDALRQIERWAGKHLAGTTSVGAPRSPRHGPSQA